MIRNLLSIILFLLFMPLSSWAAILYLGPASGEYYQGGTFIIEARIDPEGECINTVGVNLSFSQDILEVVDFSQGNSILDFWIEEPSFDQTQGRISFTGGIPGGYCGILPGDPGESNLLGKLIFKVKDAGEQFSDTAEVNFLDISQVLLNDGQGTPAKLTTRGAIFTILPEKLEVPEDEWQEELKKDNIPPEPFKIEVNQNSAIFEGKYFITFSTTDKQTGIDYFEIKEGKGDWEKVTPPYLLKDQGLENIIKVKAVDKAGNERITEYAPPKKPFPYWLIIVALLLGGIILWLVKYKKRKWKE